MNRALFWFCLTPILSVTALVAETKVKLPTSRADLATGAKLFQNQCALCHGPNGEGGRGPVLSRPTLSRAPDDEALVRVIQLGIRGTEMPNAHSMSEHDVLQTAAYVRSLGKTPLKPPPGNPAHGAEIFRGKGACNGCHSIQGEGGISAPELTGVGVTRSPVYLRQSILDPEAAVPDSYLLMKVTTKSGENVTGVRINEDSFSLQIRDPAGRSYSFWKSEIAQADKMRGKSPMPSYKDRLSEEEVTDLVAYLASLREGK